MTTTPVTGKPPRPTVPRRTWQVAAVVIVGAFMAQLDGALVNIGLATVAEDLNASLTSTQWLVSGYLLALVAGLPLCGWAARRFGAGRLWIGALTAFTLASVLCAVAGDIRSLIALRVLQGIAGGLLLPVGQTLIAQAAGRDLMGRVMSTAGAALVLAPALGPVVGGLLIAHLSWPWLFLINVPVGVAGVCLGLRVLPRGEPQPVSAFDTQGFLLVGLGLPALTYGVSVSGGSQVLGEPRFWAPVAAGVLLLAVFAGRARRATAPLLNLGLFGGRVFRAAAGASFLAGAIQFGALVVWALYFQDARGYGVIASGLAMAPFALGAAVLPYAGRLTDRFGGGPVTLAGALLTAVAVLPMALLPDDAATAVVELCLFGLGVANALSVVPPSTAAYISVPPPQVPDAVTLVNIFLRLGGAVGAALLVAVLGPGGDAGAVPGDFRTAFWWLAGLSLLAAGCATALTRAASAERGA
ncbi:DHA2 family efflux MFS transporter permease subunit [Streptomyces sp. NPDC005395]|uniref:DHA2 family efflux MFS transporter permease subunit n=1 Tax=Streptomyces sp. NPDC005395 TaxID=3157042 RepID=UPI0033AE959F